MTLLELLSRLDAENEEACIYAKKPWERSSLAIVAADSEDGRPAPEMTALQYEYFLEVFIARDFLADLRHAADDEISAEALCDRLIYYAIHDA